MDFFGYHAHRDGQQSHGFRRYNEHLQDLKGVSGQSTSSGLKGLDYIRN